MGYRLGVDLGTTFTAAAVDDGSGPSMLGLGNRALTVPSVAFLTPEGTFLFGESADRRAAAEPARSAREFKRRIGDTVPILLAGQPFSAQSLSAKLLSWVVSVATERQGGPPEQVVVTYPANWGGYKRELLDQLVSLADVPAPLTCTEPEAAATQYSSRAHLAPGDTVAVYDLGGGTFDVCVLQKQDTGFTMLGSPDGVEHLGGIDFDEAVFQHVLAPLADRMAGLDLDDPEVTAGVARLRRECIDAKEALSSDTETTVPVALPGLNTSVRLTRPELEGLVAGPLRDTLDATRRALRSAGVEASDLTTVVLVGGSSRIPLVTHLLQTEFGVPTALDTHPKHDIALGAVRYQPATPGQTAPPAAPTVEAWPTRGKKAEPAAPPPAPPPVPPTATPSPADSEDTDSEDTDSGDTDSGDTEPATPAPATQKLPTGPPIWHPPPDRGSTQGDQPRRFGGRAAVLAAAAVVALVLAVSAAVVLLTGDDEPSASPTQNPTLEPTTTSASGGRVYGENVLLVTVPSSDGTDWELHAVTVNGEDLGPVTDTIGSVDAPWASRDGRFVGFRVAEPGQGDVGPWTVQVMSADGQPVDMFTRQPQGIVCQRRVAWHPDRPEVLMGCIEDANGDGVGDDKVSTVYRGPVDADGRVDGERLERVLGVEDPTEDRPEGSPSSGMRGLGVLPTGEVLVSYAGGEEPGIHVAGPDGIRRVTSGELEDAPTVSTTGLVAFVRDDDLYVVATDGSAPPCPSPRELSQDPITGASLCNLTGDATFAENRAQDPAWSWDGSRIAFLLETGKEQRTLVVTDLAKAGPLRPVIGETANLGGIAWGPR